MMKRLTAVLLTVLLAFAACAQAESDLGTVLSGALYRIVLREDQGDITLGSGVLFADQKILLTAESCCVEGNLVAIGEDGEHEILAWEKADQTGAALMEMITPSTGTPLRLAAYDAKSLPFIFGVSPAGDIGSVQLYQALYTMYRGKEALIFSVKDRARIGKQVVIAANEILVKKAAPGLPDSYADNKMGAFLGKVVNTTAAVVTGAGQLTLSEQTRPMRGGFIMTDENVEVNCTFETLVRMEREKLEREVANTLFK